MTQPKAAVQMPTNPDSSTERESRIVIAARAVQVAVDAARKSNTELAEAQKILTSMTERAKFASVALAKARIEFDKVVIAAKG